jgi:hypothetical protein
LCGELLLKEELTSLASFPKDQNVGVYNGYESAAYDCKNATAYCYGAPQFSGLKYGEALKSGIYSCLVFL